MTIDLSYKRIVENEELFTELLSNDYWRQVEVFAQLELPIDKRIEAIIEKLKKDTIFDSSWAAIYHHYGNNPDVSMASTASVKSCFINTPVTIDGLRVRVFLAPTILCQEEEPQASTILHIALQTFRIDLNNKPFTSEVARVETYHSIVREWILQIAIPNELLILDEVPHAKTCIEYHYAAGKYVKLTYEVGSASPSCVTLGETTPLSN